MNINKLFLATVLVFSVSAAANNNIKWDEISVSYESYEAPNSELSGLSIAAKNVVENNLFFRGRYSILSGEEKRFSSIEEERKWLSLGMGYKAPVAESTDFFGVLSYERLSFKESSESSSESSNTNGHSIELGLRTLIAERIELSGSYIHLDFESSFSGFNIGAAYYFSERISAGVSFNSIDEVDRSRLTFTYNY